MKFYDRKKELNIIGGWFKAARKGALFTAIIGRTRIGKTRLWLEASKKRNERIASQIDETLNEDESGILFMREGYQIQFPSEIEVFYVAPPALDEIKRWFRDRETKTPMDEQSDH